MNDVDLSAAKSTVSVMQPWFLVQLKPNADAIAKRNLLRQGVRLFAPYEEITARRANKLIQSVRALFPGYLFASFDQEQVRWRAVNSTLGVSRLVSFSQDKPAQVPLDLISALMRRCDYAGKLLPPRFLHKGDVVRVTGGPLTEFIGTVEQLAPDQRIWVLLDILGKNTRVAIRSADLRLAG